MRGELSPGRKEFEQRRKEKRALGEDFFEEYVAADEIRRVDSNASGFSSLSRKSI